MAHKIAVSTLNASTIDILNVIRDNASLSYQNSVPSIESASDIPKVGEIIYGTPAFSNEFINALVNRIALVRVTSATFNNPYARLKKGYLDYGESVEEIFVDIVNVFEFSPEKAEARELKQYKPNVKSVFHTMNWQVIYPVSVSDEQLRQAFLSIEGVQNLIAKIVDSVYRAAEYDEYLLFKYMLIKTINAGGFKPYPVNTSDPKNYAKAFRGVSNILPFMRSDYNIAGVKNPTPKERQVIFMDAQFNADFDVDVLSAAFNMSKADFMGSLFLIDDWTSFDNDRWAVIRENSDGIEEVTAAELLVMADVKAVLLDEDWFQIYDNLNRFTEKFVAAGLRWNYFYHVWKTVSWSPYANAVVFIAGSAPTAPAALTFTVGTKSVADSGAWVFTLENNGLEGYRFEQDSALTAAGIAVHPFGAFMWDGIVHADVSVTSKPTVDYMGEQYVAASNVITTSVDAVTEDITGYGTSLDVGDTVTFNKVV